MRKEKFGVAVDEEIVEEVDELVAESADPGDIVRSSERQILCTRQIANGGWSPGSRGCHNRHPSSSRPADDSNAKLAN